MSRRAMLPRSNGSRNRPARAKPKSHAPRKPSAKLRKRSLLPVAHLPTSARLSLPPAKHGPEPKRSAQKRAIADAMKAAAAELSNTPTVAKTSYVDPRVVDRYRAGETVDPDRPHAAESETLALLFESPKAPIAEPAEG